MAVDHEDIAIRGDVWEKANELVGPLVEEHGIEKVTLGSIFSTGDVVTPVDLHINSIIRVADWLLGKDY